MSSGAPGPMATQAASVQARHFGLALYGAISQVIAQVAQTQGSLTEALSAFPFLAGYSGQLNDPQHSLAPADQTPGWWVTELRELEARTPHHLPLRALRQAARLSDDELSLWLAVGLPEQDARFGLLYEAMQVSAALPQASLGLLAHWWRQLPDARSSVQHLYHQGLIDIPEGASLRLNTPLHLDTALWDALRGAPVQGSDRGWRHTPHGELPEFASLCWPDDLHDRLADWATPSIAGPTRALVIRGAAHNGRRTLLAALAQRWDQGLLEGLGLPSVQAWRSLGPLATALHALPLLRLELGSAETATLPTLRAYTGPLGVLLGHQGGLDGPAAEQASTVNLELPGPAERAQLWAQVSGNAAPPELPRLSRGYLVRLARTFATQPLSTPGRIPAAPGPQLISRAARDLGRQALEGLATLLETPHDWTHLSVDPEIRQELALLARRIQQRERLPELLRGSPHAPMVGVRALLTGPSGTGKTLAARVLAGVLGRDLYRLDLAGLVNKYLGETEKNLERVFSRAEELDVLLLLDEGDALLTARTGVQNANDRYANLETNYLLQRLENFSGVLLITSNSADRIDSAFQRRLDAVIELQAPQAPERGRIWSLHLPAGHAVSAALLSQLAQRCSLSGGQIRNAALHALLLALEDQTTLTDSHLEAAVQREYRKLGQLCPLRRDGVAAGPTHRTLSAHG